jgi:hypothetical protein
MKNILFKIIMNFDGKGYVKCKYVPTLNKIYFTLFNKQFNTDVHKPIGVTVSNGIDTVEQHKKQKPPANIVYKIKKIPNESRFSAEFRGK